MINGTHSLPQALPPKLEEVKMSPAPTPVPVPSPLDTKEVEKEGGEEKKAEETNDGVESIDKIAKTEATQGDAEVGKNRCLCFAATIETHHIKDTRKHDGQKQRGWVTAIILFREKDACRLDEYTTKSRLFTRVPPKFTAVANLPVKIQHFFGNRY